MNLIDPVTVSNIILSVDEARAARYCRQCSGGNVNCHQAKDGHYSGWFPAICHDLGTHFANQGLAAYSKCTAGGKEFLLDFVLLEAEVHDGSPKNIGGTVLGMEVEWDVKVPDATSCCASMHS
jgi:hypothetical protein